MCVQLTLIKNRRYTITKKNRGEIPVLTDPRQRNVWIPCEKCYLCVNRKSREWQMRMMEDIKANPNAKIVTLTFSTEHLVKIKNGQDIKGKQIREKIKLDGYDLDNEICRIATKGFRERWRKKYGKSPRHWFITELGHGETEHVHMHGIIWEDARYKLKGKLLDEVEKIWAYGFIGRGKLDVNTGQFINYVDERTPRYFTKYVNKVDEMHPNYKQIILTSPGIGAAYIKSDKAKDHKWQGRNTNQRYTMDNGGTLPLPQYFRQKLWTDEQRIQLASWALDENCIYIEGKKISREIGEVAIAKMYRELRAKNQRLGFTKYASANQKIYERMRRHAIHKKRFEEEEKELRLKHTSQKELKTKTTDWIIKRQMTYEETGLTENYMPKELTISEDWTPDWVWDGQHKMIANEDFYYMCPIEKEYTKLPRYRIAANQKEEKIVQYYRANIGRSLYTIKAENATEARIKVGKLAKWKWETVKWLP